MNFSARFTLSVLSPLLLLAEPPAAHALQTVEATDGVTVEAVLSIKEPTRIRIEGAAITNVFGNIYSSDCAANVTAVPGAAAPAAPAAPAANGMPPGSPQVNPAGEIALGCDADKGEIYVRPVGPAGKPVNLFVSSHQGTYTLLLRRSDTPADTIVIKDKSLKQGKFESANGSVLGRQSQHVRALKNMLTAMASDRVPSDIQVTEVNRPIQLWVEARFALTRLYEGRGLIGERYSLTNVGTADMVLAEQEFDREAGRVLGVAIEHHNLRPGESTTVFVIREGA